MGGGIIYLLDPWEGWTSGAGLRTAPGTQEPLFKPLLLFLLWLSRGGTPERERKQI